MLFQVGKVRFKADHRFVVAFLGTMCLGSLIEYAALFHLTSSAAETQTSSIQNALITEMISQINQSEIFNMVYDLQTLTTRVYGTAGNSEAGTYLYNKLDRISRLEVGFQGGSYRNIIATLDGTDSASTATYIVGAHYDSKSSDPNDAPGATDNGGGVAIVLELARIMSRYKFRHTLKFALWNYEEGGLVGSTDYAQYASNNELNIPLYFNYDSACYDPDDRFVLDIMYDSQSSWVKDMMAEYNALYSIGFSLTYNVHTCSSDHVPFRNNGYTAVMTHAETHGTQYHTPADTVDKISTLYAKKNGQLGTSVLAELADIQGPWNQADTEPPHVSVFSPRNETYSANSLSLMFSLDESTSWMGYSVDGQENVTIGGNATVMDLPNGVHKIVVYARDAAGNMGRSNVVHFTVDTTSPLGSVAIAEGAAYTNSTSVTLTLSAENSTSSIVQMSFRNADNATWSGWEPYFASKSWTLSIGDGMKTVFVRFSYDSGLVSPVSQDTIILDTEKPEANAGNNQARVDMDSSVFFDAGASTDNMGILVYAWDFGDGTTDTGKTTTHMYTSLGTYTVTLTVEDAAHNSASDSITVTVNSSEALPMWIEAIAVAAIGTAAVSVAAAASVLLRRRK